MSCENKKNNCFKIANLDDKAKLALKKKEDNLKMELGKDFILIAYEKE
ncbi:hypothetical protein JYG23_10430 [Sedimentibacter sp. zth1]|nr:hypothetical protein [Sedimentibacter sp. zth1]QSX05101.1 hypothetical protein JYG23_10430 [Sedimentibacter sp. zth1]